jgi:hypothetical protein
MKVLNIATAMQRRPWPNRAAAQHRSEPAIVIEFPRRRTYRDRALVVLSDDGWQDWPADVSGRTDLTF